MLLRFLDENGKFIGGKTLSPERVLSYIRILEFTQSATIQDENEMEVSISGIREFDFFISDEGTSNVDLIDIYCSVIE